MENPTTLKWLVVIILIPIFLFPLAMRSGRAKAARMRGLTSDLKQGRLQGYAIILIVVAIVIIATVKL